MFDERNFRRAAVRLGMSPSALSRTVRALEARLGVRLLNRTTRSVAPTEAGRTLRDRVQPRLREIAEALQAVGASQDRPRGKLRLNVPSLAARLAIMPKLGAYLATYPDVRVELIVDNDLTDIVGRGFDAGVRAGHQVSRDMVAVRLTADLRMAVVGTPDYFGSHPPPRTPRDLTEHRCLTYAWAKTGAHFPWSFEASGQHLSVEVESVLVANDTDVLLMAALQGIGLAFLEEGFVAPHLASGQLVRVLDGWCKPFSGFHLYYAQRSHMPATLRAFIDHVKRSVP